MYSTRATVVDRKTTYETKQTIDTYITPEDYRMIKRLVGYSEYLKALQMLDELSRSLDEEEYRQVDEYVSERNTLAVENNLSRDLENKGSTLADPPGTEEEKRGLNWVTALARLELGSMLAAYTNVPRPFEAVRPTERDIDAYRSLLLDAFRTHYWALKQDPVAERLPGTKNVTAVLAYSRRMIMLKGMVDTLSRAGRNWTFPEIQEITQWNSELNEFRGMLSLYLHAFLQKQQSSMRNTVYENFVVGCGRRCLGALKGYNLESKTSLGPQKVATGIYADSDATE